MKSGIVYEIYWHTMFVRSKIGNLYGLYEERNVSENNICDFLIGDCNPGPSYIDL